MDNIRYYKGKQKLIRLTKSSPLHTCLYKVLDTNGEFPLGTKQILLHRMCWREKKNVKKIQTKSYQTLLKLSP